jgi:uncharacterized protein (DUF58 family)
VSRRSGRAIALGLVALLAAWLFGSVPVVVVAIGLVLAGATARLWARFAVDGITADRHLAGTTHVEGDDVAFRVDVRARRYLPVGAITMRQPFGALGARELRLRSGHTQTVLEAVPRGCYTLAQAEIVLEDPLGLEHVSVLAGPPLRLTVRPRIVEPAALFGDGGRRELGGRRARLRSASGYELHAVRDYRDGEPLRAVHWPSTARRSRLMVKDMDDAPKDDVVVVLDQDPLAVAGERGSSSFDAAVRAAGSIVRAHAACGRRTALLLTGAEPEVVRVRSLARDWSAALDALAAAEPDARAEIASVLSDPRLPAARAADLVVVTGRPDAVVEALCGRRGDGRLAALVAVDVPTFAGTAPSRATPGLLRAAAVGVGVAVIRAGEDLAAALAGTARRRASGAQSF